MRNYKCRDCGYEFDRPCIYRECVGEFWGQPAYEEFSECPECGSFDFDDYNTVIAEMEGENETE